MNLPISFFRRMLTAAAAAALSLAPLCALAADFPSRPIQLSIVFSPGGALDSAARVLAQEAEKSLGQKIIPSNDAGGGGMPGVAKVLRSAPGGYTIGACVSNALIFIPHKNEAPYRPLRDAEPLLTFGQASPVLVVRPDSPWADLESFLDATRKASAAKSELRVGVPGLGTPSHIALAMMAAKDPALVWRFVPFGGAGEVEAALLGGHVDAAASGALPRIRQGQLKPLLALASSAPAALPDLPALPGKGFADPGQGDSTFVLLAPAGTPGPVLDRLEEAFMRAAQSEAFAKAMEGYPVTPALRGRAEAKAFLRQAWDNESGVLRAVGLGDAPATKPE